MNQINFKLITITYYKKRCATNVCSKRKLKKRGGQILRTTLNTATCLAKTGNVHRIACTSHRFQATKKKGTAPCLSVMHDEKQYLQLICIVVLKYAQVIACKLPP